MEQIPKEVAWLVSFVLIEAAVIDGRCLRVPNWLTFHFVAGGLIFAFWKGGSALLLLSVLGAVVGLMTLLPLYSIGGMGAGDVKLMAGVGAWIGPWLTLWAFLSSAMVGSRDGGGHDRLLRRAVPAPGHDAHDRPRGVDHPQPGGAVRTGGPAQAHDEALALRHSDRGRHDCFFRLDRLVDLIALFHGFSTPRQNESERRR